ncbi:MAG TPA: hypothetical protein VD978_35655 [Azospirillum sp.]|nr:hypothetical protein [Azospirillum sp.]
MTIEGYLGFRVGDVVLDVAELTAGTATIKEFHLVPSHWSNGPTAIAVMENGAERYVIQLKKVLSIASPTREDEDDTGNVVKLHRSAG